MNVNITVLHNTTSCSLLGTYIMETVCAIRTFVAVYFGTQHPPEVIIGISTCDTGTVVFLTQMCV